MAVRKKYHILHKTLFYTYIFNSLLGNVICFIVQAKSMHAYRIVRTNSTL